MGACVAAAVYEVGRPERLSVEEAQVLEAQWQDFARFADASLARGGRCHETEVFRAFRRTYGRYRSEEALSDSRLRDMIRNIGSVAGIRPRPGLSWYNASKGAVNVLSKSMAVELGPENIRVNAICPVMGVTGLFEDFMGLPDTPTNRAKFLGTIPLGRFAQASDVAAAAVFLASDAAEFFTGLEMPVDGGRTI
jgi:NAD(P)-dependent dehydrogenase (short-subunit alcohol dehydrogenase family)